MVETREALPPGLRPDPAVGRVAARSGLDVRGRGRSGLAAWAQLLMDERGEAEQSSSGPWSAWFAR